MNKVNFSDRVWCTLLWEFIRYSGTKFSLATETADKEAAVAAFMGFLKENSELLDANAVIEWAKSKQSTYWCSPRFPQCFRPRQLVRNR